MAVILASVPDTNSRRVMESPKSAAVKSTDWIDAIARWGEGDRVILVYEENCAECAQVLEDYAGRSTSWDPQLSFLPVRKADLMAGSDAELPTGLPRAVLIVGDAVVAAPSSSLTKRPDLYLDPLLDRTRPSRTENSAAKTRLSQLQAYPRDDNPGVCLVGAWAVCKFAVAWPYKPLVVGKLDIERATAELLPQTPGQYELVVRFPVELEGENRLRIELTEETGETAIVEAVVTGRSSVAVMPRLLDFGALRLGDESTRQVDVVVTGNDELPKLVSRHPNVTVQFDSQAKLHDGVTVATYSVKLSTQQLPCDNFLVSLQLESDLTGVEFESLYVQATVCGDLNVIPRSLHFGVGYPGEERRLTLALNSHDGRVASLEQDAWSVSSDSPSVRATQNGPQAEVVLVFPPEAGFFQGHLVVTKMDEIEPRVEIPFSAITVAKQGGVRKSTSNE